MQFDYLYMMQATGSLNIEDIGNVTLHAFNDFYKQYFLIIQTQLGRTKIVEYGPIFVNEVEEPPNQIIYTYNEFEYSESKICKAIDKFLNNAKAMITQVNIIEKDEAVDKIKDLVNFLW